MDRQMLEKTRRLHQLLQKVLIIDHKGAVLGQAGCGQFEQTLILPDEIKEDTLTSGALEWIDNVSKTELNLCRKGREGYCLMVPVSGGKGRICATLYIRDEASFGDDEILLAEYGANVAAMQIQRFAEQKLELEASKLAEEYRLTRSVIVNALRKLESAGVIDARSLGMKGTYIKVLNECLYQELAAI